MVLEVKEISVLETNRTYKNDFFQKVFENPERIKDVVKLFSKMEVNEVKIANVEPILLGKRENDLSFFVDDVYYYMIEAQSTFNPNMPFRILHYLTTALLRLIESEDLYTKYQVKLKVPKLFTLFTGLCDKVPEKIIFEQRISNAFEIWQEQPDLEVIVHTYDFNMLKEEVKTYLDLNKIPKRLQEFTHSSILGYALFCNSVDYLYKSRKWGSEGEKVQGLHELCKLFLDRGIFVDLFNDKEVINMTVDEFSREKELLYVGREEGIIEGSVKMLAELGISKEIALEKIMENHGLIFETAEKYIKEYYSELS